MLKKIIVLLGMVTSTLFFGETEFVKMEISGKVYKFELANTSEARSKGLMFRRRLDKESGMLFVYSKTRYLHFYMKDTLVPLDIAFIDKNYEVIDIQSMQPLDETTVSSRGEAQYALEVNRGFFDEFTKLDELPRNILIYEFDTFVEKFTSKKDLELLLKYYRKGDKYYTLKNEINFFSKKKILALVNSYGFKKRLKVGDFIKIITPIQYLDE